MDFSSRSAQPQNVTPGTHVPAATPASGGRKGQDKGKMGRIVFVAITAIVVILLVALVAFLISNNKSGQGEEKYVDSSRLQAVFLNTGQVYFGNIKELNSSYFVVTNIYYLQTSSTGTSASAANSSVSLVKLGCELHEPYDQMVINRSQVTFWENLQEGGQVSKAVTAFEKANPNGQKCVDQSSSSPATSSSVQNAGNSNSGSSTTTPAKP